MARHAQAGAPRPLGGATPSFTIVIPTYGRPQQLALCLEALAELDYPRDCFDVVVVDDGSETPPESVIARFRSRLEITLVKQEHRGPATARNTGAASARGEFVAFTDDDCRPDPGWLRAFAAAFALSPTTGLGGRTLNALDDNPYSGASQLLIQYLYTYYNSPAGPGRFFTSNNLALPKLEFLAIGGFDSSFPQAAAEDRDLCDRWLHEGHGMTYVPEALVFHAHTLTLRGFCRQHFGYGRGAWHYHRGRSRRGQGRIRLEPLPFYVNLLRYPLSRTEGWGGALLAALMPISQLAMAAGFYWEGARRAASSCPPVSGVS